MATPIEFPSVTQNLALPLLFAGQAQKEFSINQALLALDAVMPRSVIASASAPPTAPAEGEAYRVLSGASGDWAGHEDDLALWIGGAWVFAPPTEGMVVYDRGAAVLVIYRDGWQSGSEPIAPTGGDTIDVEARTAIEGLIEALRTAGVLPQNA